MVMIVDRRYRLLRMGIVNRMAVNVNKIMIIVNRMVINVEKILTTVKNITD